jgi:hypothetical protein
MKLEHSGATDPVQDMTREQRAEYIAVLLAKRKLSS